jgi:hypothetical protein
VKAVDPDKDYHAMNKLTGLLKEHQVGEWCKRAAWTIAAIGLIEIVLTIYTLISQLQPGNTNYYNPPNWGLSMMYAHLFPLFFTIAQLIFFFFALYAAGVFLNHFVANTEEDNEEGQDELIVEEEGEHLKPGQFTEIQ